MFENTKLRHRELSVDNQVVTLQLDGKLTERKPLASLSAQIIPLSAHTTSISSTQHPASHPKEYHSMEHPSLETSQYILNNAPMAIMITDDAGLVLWCNETMGNWTNCDTSNCIGRNETTILGINDHDDSSTQIPTTNGPFILGQIQAGEDRRVMRYPLPIVNGKQTVFYIDVSEEETLRSDRTQLAQQLEQHNTVDVISGLLNDRAIQKGLEPLLSRSRRYQNPLSVVTMDIINFDAINVAAGQVGVDKVIVAVSQLLRDQMRWADLVGRLNSGQFIFVLPETDKAAAVALANKLASQLNSLNVTVDDQLSVQPQACFGVSAWEKGDDSRLLLARSNEAVQTAKQNGGFSVEAA